MRYANGNIYTGQFAHDQVTGFGTMRYDSGDVFEGTWENGLQQGLGAMTANSGNVTAEAGEVERVSMRGMWSQGVMVQRILEQSEAVRHCPSPGTIYSELEQNELLQLECVCGSEACKHSNSFKYFP